MAKKDTPYTNREIREKWHSIANTLHEIQLTQQKAKEDFVVHQEDDHDRFISIDKQLTEIKTLLVPISDTYRTVATLGKWSKIALATLLLLLSIGLALRSFVVWK